MLHCASAETASSMHANNFRREVGDGYVKLECAADASGPRLLASHFVVSSVPRASHVKWGRARGAGHRIGPCRTEGGFRRAAGNEFLSGAPQISLEAALGDAAEDALKVAILGIINLISGIVISIICMARFPFNC
jgi:hypothetical protein